MKSINTIVCLFIISLFSSCTNDDGDNAQPLRGIYIETSPVYGRSQLDFVNSEIVVKSEPSNSTEDEFYYKITGNIITLTPRTNTSVTQEFTINILSPSIFEIENLYPTVGVNPPPYMTFKK